MPKLNEGLNELNEEDHPVVAQPQALRKVLASSFRSSFITSLSSLTFLENAKLLSRKFATIGLRKPIEYNMAFTIVDYETHASLYNTYTAFANLYISQDLPRVIPIYRSHVDLR